MPNHKNASLGQRHPIHDKDYTGLSDAQGATWDAADIGKSFRITDEPNYYIIKTSGGEFLCLDAGDVQTVSTTDATETSIGTYTTADDYVYHVEAEVLGTVNGGGNAATYKLIASFKNDSGTLSQIGSTTTVHSAEDAAGWDATIDSSGTDIRVRVTGVAATNIDWRADTKIKVLDNGA